MSEMNATPNPKPQPSFELGEIVRNPVGRLVHVKTQGLRPMTKVLGVQAYDPCTGQTCWYAPDELESTGFCVRQ